MKMDMVSILALLAGAALLPGAAAGETSIEYSFNESHAEVYEQMLAENAAVGEYYERVCPEFLEGMPPEKQVAIGMASPGPGVCGVPVPLYTIGLLALFGVVILALLAAVALVLERVCKKKE